MEAAGSVQVAVTVVPAVVATLVQPAMAVPPSLKVTVLVRGKGGLVAVVVAV